MEALLRDAQHLLELALGGEVAHDDAGAQLLAGVAVFLDGLGDGGMEQPAVARAEGHLAARPRRRAAERVVGQGALGARAGDEVMQAAVLAQNLVRLVAEPAGEGLVDVDEAPIAVDRVEAGRGILEEIDDLLALLADHLFHLAARGHILDAPQHVTVMILDRIGRDAAPCRLAGRRDAAHLGVASAA